MAGKRNNQITVPRGYSLVEKKNTPTRRKKKGTTASSKSDAMNVGMSVIVINLLTKYIGQAMGKNLSTLPSYALPGIIYFIAKRGWIPIKGLETVALVMLINQVMEGFGMTGTPTPKTGFSYEGFNFGASSGSQVTGKRSEGETARQIQLAKSLSKTDERSMSPASFKL